MLSAMTARANVIVSAYNQLEFLRLTLRGYLRQTTNDFALTVADDGSRDGTREFLREFAGELEALGIKFRHVWQEDEGFRKGAIVNEAVYQEGVEPLLIFADGDCIPPAYFVERHLAAHEPWSYHVGGAHRLAKEISATLTAEDVDSGRFETLGDATHRKALRRLRRKSFWGTLLHQRRRPKILGLNYAMDRDLYVALNGHDERFTEYGLEDTDLGDRAMRLKPRPRVKNLYTLNDNYHLWHPQATGGRETSLELYERMDRPPRCELGLDGRDQRA